MAEAAVHAAAASRPVFRRQPLERKLDGLQRIPASRKSRPDSVKAVASRAESTPGVEASNCQACAASSGRREAA